MAHDTYKLNCLISVQMLTSFSEIIWIIQIVFILQSLMWNCEKLFIPLYQEIATLAGTNSYWAGYTLIKTAYKLYHGLSSCTGDNPRAKTTKERPQLQSTTHPKHQKKQKIMHIQNGNNISHTHAHTHTRTHMQREREREREGERERERARER